jgi:hypothetical protein
MNIGDLEPITGGEKEFFNRKIGKRLIFQSENDGTFPKCPKCGHSKKVFKACDVYVCSEFHAVDNNDT